MAFDPTLPATGVTKFGDLYAILRANFVGLSAGGVEAWTDIGSGGSSWGTDWGNTSETYPAGFMKDPMGFVHLRGLTFNEDGLLDTSVFTLPSGYYPDQRVHYMCNVAIVANESVIRQFVIKVDGVASCGGLSGVTWVYLDGITYKAA